MAEHASSRYEKETMTFKGDCCLIKYDCPMECLLDSVLEDASALYTFASPGEEE
jgi:hypothetical protein